MNDPVILAQELRKSYGAFEAVRGIDFEVEPGTSFGLLGPNGAGKSTTMRMVAGVSHRSGGRLRILGMDPDEQGPRIRAHLGVVPQNDNLDAQLTVRENLIFYGRYFGLPKRWLAAKAEELGLPILDEAGFLSLLEKGPAGLNGGDAAAPSAPELPGDE